MTTVCYFAKIFMFYVQGNIIVVHLKHSSISRHLHRLEEKLWDHQCHWYMRLSSSSGLSTSFVGPFGTYLSYIVNKHKSMVVNTLFVINPFLIIINTTKRKYLFWKSCTRCVSQARKVLKACPTNWTSSVGTRT